MIKLLRKQIFARIVLSCILLNMVLNTRQAKAQFVVSDPTNLVQNTATAIATVLTEVSQAMETLQNYEFYKYLRSATNGVKTYHKVTQIIESQQRILHSIQNSLQTVRQYKSLTPEQINGMAKMYMHFAQQAKYNADQLTNVFRAGVLQMSDAERIALIDGIDKDIRELDDLLVYYDIMNSSLAAEQQRKATDIQTISSFYEAKAGAKVSEAQAASSIGGLYGSIVNILYGLSALVALVGSVKVYSQFTLGNGRVVETAGSWFGAVLISVLLTTFIRFLFF